MKKLIFLAIISTMGLSVAQAQDPTSDSWEDDASSNIITSPTFSGRIGINTGSLPLTYNLQVHSLFQDSDFQGLTNIQLTNHNTGTTSSDGMLISLKGKFATIKSLDEQLHIHARNRLILGGDIDAKDLYILNSGFVGIEQETPRTLLHVGEKRAVIAGPAHGFGGEYVGFNSFIGADPEGRISVTKLGGGTTSVDGQTGGGLILTDYDGNMEFMTYNTSDANGEIFGISYDPKMVFDNRGYLGIGTQTPGDRLEVYDGNILLGGEYKRFIFHTQFWDENASKLIIAPENNGAFDWNRALVLHDNGRLDVQGKLYAEEIEVRLTPFPDYVFDEDYDRLTLNELEGFIKQNHHLPGMPSAGEVEENGLGVGELLKLQMEKIEELTLYIIELKNELESLK